MTDKTDALRVTPEMVDLEIRRELYHVPEGTTLTICTIELQNSFTVTGESACADPKSFNLEEGQQRAKAEARKKVFLLLAFRLRDEAHSQENRRDEARETLRGTGAAKSDPLVRAALEDPQETVKRFLSERCSVDGSDSSFTSTSDAITAFQKWQEAEGLAAWPQTTIKMRLQKIDQINGKSIRFLKEQITGWTGFKLKAIK
ncbi:hypothetical protein ETW23_00335 [Leisingera sp. NJS201]|nr:hypothetical protein ETW23_00335 [Leisingera sp. NJS201]